MAKHPTHRPASDRARGACTRRGLRVATYPVCLLLAGCGGWSSQDEGGGGPTAPAPSPDAGAVGADCLAAPVANPAASAEVNAAFCVGVAISGGEGVVCEPAAAGRILCVDTLIDYAYVVSWSGTSGSVLEAQTGAPLGSVRVLGDGFAVTLRAGVTSAREISGVCTLETVGGVSYAELCPASP